MDYVDLIKHIMRVYIKDKLAIIDYRYNNTPLLFRR